MPARADAVLAAIPMLAVSGLALRTAIAITGVGTALLGVPLAPAGYVAAFALVCWELIAGPVPDDSGGEST